VIRGGGKAISGGKGGAAQWGNGGFKNRVRQGEKIYKKKKAENVLFRRGNSRGGRVGDPRENQSLGHPTPNQGQ